MAQNYGLPALGAGVGLRGEHFEEILATRPVVGWFEIIAENFLDCGGYPRKMLDRVREHYRIIPHGVCLSIGSTDDLDLAYLKRLKTFLDELEAPWYSDHLCFTIVDHTNLNELLPLPFTEESAKNVISRVKIVQEILERPFLLENITRYFTIDDGEMTEDQFIRTVLEEGDCGLLLDVTNVYLNSVYHGYDPLGFIRSLPLERVGQMHLAGWEERKGEVIDSHDAPVPPEVWSLFRSTLELTGPSSVLIEWDKELPRLERLVQEARFADRVIDEVIASHSGSEELPTWR